jgi:hypothetical protein
MMMRSDSHEERTEVVCIVLQISRHVQAICGEEIPISETAVDLPNAS